MAMLLNTGRPKADLDNAKFDPADTNVHTAAVSSLTNGPGFELVTFIEKNAAQGLIDQTGSVGIWIYPAVEVDLDNDLCMVAVGSGADTIELRHPTNNFCFCCYPDAEKSTREISIAEGGEMVNDRRPTNTIKNRAAFQDLVNNDKLKALFHQDQIDKLIKEPGDMLRLEVVDMLFSDDVKPQRSIAISSANKSGAVLGDMIVSLTPCPPKCPTDGGYL